MNVNFPFEKRSSKVFGAVYRPVAIVSFWSEVIKGWSEISMIVDTGADYTILPRYEATKLGVNLHKDCYRQITEGVGGAGTVYFLRSWKAKLGSREFKIPIGFLNVDNIPPLLGRQDFLEKIRTVFDKHVTTFELADEKHRDGRDGHQKESS